MGWIGNIFLISGQFAIGGKNRSAFIWVGIGEIFWIIRSIQLGILDGIFLGVIFLSLQIINWMRWK